MHSNEKRAERREKREERREKREERREKRKDRREKREVRREKRGGRDWEGLEVLKKNKNPTLRMWGIIKTIMFLGSRAGLVTS